jgi:hypothetical protein
MSNGTTSTRITNAKVYETSIVPKGETMVPARPQGFVATSGQIEVLHIGVFILVFFCIFGGIWKAAIQSEKDEENRASSTGLNHK